MNHLLMERDYKKCFNDKYFELCKTANDSTGILHNSKTCGDVEFEEQAKINASDYCRQKIKIYQYPKFK